MNNNTIGNVNNHANTNANTDDPFLHITTEAIDIALGIQPRGFQCTVIPHMLKMGLSSHSQPIHPALLVQSTVGGKSSVCQTIGIVKSGISLIV